MPTVSIIIPTYNRAGLISECIESVLRQTYKDFEIIVVDDGSDDNTEDILKVFKDTIKYIRQENAGVSAARNRGIRESSGRYVAFLDSDDIWLEDKLELQTDFLEKNPDIVMVCGNGIYLDGKDEGKPVIRAERAHEYEKGHLTLRDAFYRFPIRTSTMVVRRDVLVEMGMFNTKYVVAEDMELVFKILLKYGKSGFINAPLYKLKKGAENLSLNEVRKQTWSISVLEELFIDNPVAEKILGKRAIRNRLAYRYYHLGQGYDKQGDKINALNAFKKALTYRPFYPSCLLQYLLCLIKKG